ncbi:transcription initiation factor TFIID subunit 7, partial [Lecanoromycetidae sp. Uapishka_2]
MSEKRPSLKLKLGTSSIKQEPIETPILATPSTSTPKIKLKFGANKSLQAPALISEPDTSTPVPISTKPKPVRKPKPTPKKRALEAESSDNEDEENAISGPTSQPQIKKIKLTTKGSMPRLQIHAKGKIPKRPRGVGYDSEADDREADPMISESLILRMAPGPDCDTLRKAISENNIGSRKTGGVDVRIRFLRTDCRRAVVTVNGHHYAACMVDLPCIIEAMKSWFPKNGWIKSADICQMLIVMGPIKTEDEAMTYPLPGVVKGELDEQTWQYAHGLTPPLRWVRKRRFRHRISVRTVMQVEEEVERLLRADEEAEGESKFELIDEHKYEDESGSGEYDDGEQDAEGEDEDIDQSQYIQTIEGEVQPEEDEEEAAARLAAEMEAGMMDDFDDDPAANGLAQDTITSAGPISDSPAGLDTGTPPSTAETPAGLTPSAAATPAGAADTSSAADDDESEEESDEDEEVDEDQLEKQQDLQRQREEIADLEAAIKAVQDQLAKQGNPLLRKRLLDKMKDLQRDLELKIGAVGEGREQ